MAIDSLCTGCGKTLRVGDEFAGRKARCPSCKTIYTVSNAQSSTIDSGLAETSYAAPGSGVDAVASPTISLSALASSFNTVNSPVTGMPVQQPRRYMVRTPTGDVYGPADSQDVQDWIQQGRLDNTCHVRLESDEQWIGIPAWLFQIKKEVASSQSFLNQKNPFAAPVSANHSAKTGQTGQGGVILLLGISSWLLCFSLFGGIICAVIAITMSVRELKKIREGESAANEKTFVIIGLSLSVLNLLVTFGSVIVAIILSILTP